MLTATAVIHTPQDIWAHHDEIRQRLAAMDTPLLAVDFDGALAPTVGVPALAELPRELKPILRRLSAAGATTIVVSGRALDDLQPRIGLPLIYAGNHGLEIRGSGLEYTVPAAYELRYELLRVCNELRAGLAPFAGALVEYKRLSASVHVRQVDSDDLPAVAGVVETTVANHGAFCLCGGKEVFEIRPDVGWNQGSAVRWVLERVGGNETDVISIGGEDLHREFRTGVTVEAGADPLSSAQYRLGADEIAPFLRLVCDTLMR